ncbi:hypothetical protein cyc_05210 [Cyclospora cayetanensis]|uniref:Uncharacterized protein n=1 Tax=Cyclospora cayetanensis TaxID=88456 RepID=A0A1D3CSP2_9EIME|nr:hypothetical protein cyc_05210 [Cyclospora cayetanensis]
MQGQGQDPTEVFKRAVASVLAQWTLLNLAVEQGWGGRESYKKRQLLYEDLVSEFKESERTHTASLPVHTKLSASQMQRHVHSRISKLGTWDEAPLLRLYFWLLDLGTTILPVSPALPLLFAGECGASECSETHEALETLMASTAIVPSTADNIGTAI